MSKPSLRKRTLLALMGFTGPVLFQAQCTNEEVEAVVANGVNDTFLNLIDLQTQNFFNQLFGVDD